MQSVFEQDLERLVKQYDQPGPRYTSYPTVPVSYTHLTLPTISRV